MAVSINCPTCGTSLKSGESASAAKACPYCGAAIPVTLLGTRGEAEIGKTVVHVGSAVEIVDAVLVESAPPPPIPRKKPVEPAAPPPLDSASRDNKAPLVDEAPPAGNPPPINAAPPLDGAVIDGIPIDDAPMASVPSRWTWQRIAILASPVAALLLLSLIGLSMRSTPSSEQPKPVTVASKEPGQTSSSGSDYYGDKPAVSASPAPAYQSSSAPTAIPPTSYSPPPTYSPPAYSPPSYSPPVYTAPATSGLSSQQQARRDFLVQEISRLQAAIEKDQGEVLGRQFTNPVIRGFGNRADQIGRTSDKASDNFLGPIIAGGLDYLANQVDKDKAAIQARIDANQRQLWSYQDELSRLNAQGVPAAPSYNQTGPYTFR